MWPEARLTFHEVRLCAPRVAVAKYRFDARGSALMPNAEPHRLTATTLVRLIADGVLTAEAVVASCLERIAEREPVVRAWSHLAAEAALAQARELGSARQKTFLGGGPFGIKDIFDTADMPTTYGSPIYVGCRRASEARAPTMP